ncbi:hypothetical protein [Agromyces marinus]|uniref:hypothetical protein n=1 Tax=Agromyces marinus TaxID=1389020 RepID=UPI001F37F1E5|nr:hypothetical protein [Agromyces marinus]UIP57914.1 hypothetical protein DSM26151_07810 [Agromyces marinus]
MTPWPTPHVRRIGLAVLWWVALVGLVVANLLILIPGIVSVRLWEDEALNLTVPLNLVRGLGYASDGTLSGSTLTPFDVRISTGPVLLLPTAGLIALGVDPVVAGRLLATLGWVGLLVALGLVGRRLGGRWAALVAIAVPVAFETAALPSPIQTPADILGEVTAAALLAAALLFVHRRPWLAGLLVGLAIQAKFVALLAIPAFTVAVLLDAAGPIGARLRMTIPRVLVAALAAAVPTLVFELVKLLTLGFAGYVDNLRDFAYFLLSGGQLGYAVTPAEKADTLAASWNLPPELAAFVGVAVAATAALVFVVAWGRVRRAPGLLRSKGAARAEPSEFAAIVLVALLGVATYLAWWMLSRHTPAWIRHPAPGVLAFVPVVAAALVPATRVAWRGLRTHVVRTLVAGVAALAVVALAWSVVGRVTTVGTRPGATGETLPHQRAAAAEIAELGHDRLATWWGAGVSVAVLAGSHIGLTDAGESTAGDPTIWSGTPRVDPCEVEVVAGRYTVCAARP